MNREFLKETRIVVSGVGMVTPLGVGAKLSWSRLLNGDCGIRSTDEGLVADVVGFSENGARSRMGDFALIAAREALDQAGLDETRRESMTIGCAVSQSKPIVLRMDPTLLLSSFTGWSASDVVHRDFHFTGPCSNVVAACATGIASIDLGVSWLMSGACDAALVGASESSLTTFYRSGFQQLGVLAPGPDPRAVRPFDRDRCGFAMGEGAGVLLIETEQNARARGHTPLAVIEQVVLRQTRFDLMRFDHDGSAVASLVRAVCDAAPDYINAHGTATFLNDRMETQGFAQAFGSSVDSVAVSSTKASTGHLLGAAGAVEAVISVLALRDQQIPPTLNFEVSDDEDRLNHVIVGRRQAVRTALSLSYGFGGQMGAVFFSDKFQ